MNCQWYTVVVCLSTACKYLLNVFFFPEYFWNSRFYNMAYVELNREADIEAFNEISILPIVQHCDWPLEHQVDLNPCFCYFRDVFLVFSRKALKSCTASNQSCGTWYVNSWHKKITSAAPMKLSTWQLIAAMFLWHSLALHADFSFLVKPAFHSSRKVKQKKAWSANFVKNVLEHAWQLNAMPGWFVLFNFRNNVAFSRDTVSYFSCLLLQGLDGIWFVPLLGKSKRLKGPVADRN